MIISLFVLVRIVSNPLSNLFQKKLVAENDNSLLIIFVTFLFLSIAVIPLYPNLFNAALPVEYFVYMMLCAVFAVLSNAFLVKALSFSDLSLLGPINSYKPLVGMFFGIFILNEIPSLMGLLGVGLILGGSYFVVDNNSSSKFRGRIKIFLFDKGIQYRFAALFLSGVEAVFLKKALTYSTPLISMIVWCAAGFFVSLLLLPFFKRKNDLSLIQSVMSNKKLYLFLFITTAAMQFTTLLVFENMQVSYALALFQTSAIVSVFLGYKYFSEKNIVNRLIGSILMIGGSVLIILYK